MPQLVINLPYFDIDVSEQEKFIAQAKPLIQENITAWLAEYVARHLKLQIQKDFFEMSFEEFNRLAGEKQWQIRQKVFEEKKGWIEKQLKAHKAKWILVVGGQIERASSTLDDLPTKAEIYEIGKARGFAPYVFVHDALIEEIAVDIASSPWTQISRKDYYPTIQVFVGGEEWDNEKLDVAENVLTAELDTGSPIVVLDKDKLVEHKWIEDREIGIIGSHLGRTYGYFLPKLKLGLKTASGKMKSGIFRVRAVCNWKESSFCQINPERCGLIGRNVLIELSLHLLLKGDEKRTVILK